MPKEEVSSDISAAVRLPLPPLRAFPARNAHPANVRFAIKNGDQTVR